MTLPRATPSKPDSPVLPWPAQDRAERALAGPEVRAAAVVLEARQHARAAVELDLDGDVADEAGESTRTVRRSTSPSPGISSSPSS